jgi:hypothetical protein
MNKGIRNLYIGISVVALAGVGYFIYSKVKIIRANRTEADLQEVEELINNIETDTDEIEPVEPTLPLSTIDFE